MEFREIWRGTVLNRRMSLHSISVCHGTIIMSISATANTLTFILADSLHVSRYQAKQGKKHSPIAVYSAPHLATLYPCLAVSYVVVKSYFNTNYLQIIST